MIEPQDESPFMKFGYVYPGQTVPALYNNLVRAPLFRHKPYGTDFLVIRCVVGAPDQANMQCLAQPIRTTIKGEPKYYIREINNLFVVGQTYPVTEVPGPHSRKITNTIKLRLQIIAFKLLEKSTEKRLKISRLMKYFPDQNELQMRQRLKVWILHIPCCQHMSLLTTRTMQEFMEYHRRGPHQGFWRLKASWTIPSDTDMLKMVTPEQVVLSESMQVGQRHLQDSGYSYNGEVAEEDEGNLSIEQQLAPWITTKNFLFATQAKAMLKLHGEGDPTGRGEAFSFIRVSMKDIFVKAGEDYEQKLGMLDDTRPTPFGLTIQQLRRRTARSLHTDTTSLSSSRYTSPRSSVSGRHSSNLSAGRMSLSSATTRTRRRRSRRRRSRSVSSRCSTATLPLSRQWSVPRPLRPARRRTAEDRHSCATRCVMAALVRRPGGS